MADAPSPKQLAQAIDLLLPSYTGGSRFYQGDTVGKKTGRPFWDDRSDWRLSQNVEVRKEPLHPIVGAMVAELQRASEAQRNAFSGRPMPFGPDMPASDIPPDPVMAAASQVLYPPQPRAASSGRSEHYFKYR